MLIICNSNICNRMTGQSYWKPPNLELLWRSPHLFNMTEVKTPCGLQHKLTIMQGPASANDSTTSNWRAGAEALGRGGVAFPKWTPSEEFIEVQFQKAQLQISDHPTSHLPSGVDHNVIIGKSKCHYNMINGNLVCKWVRPFSVRHRMKQYWNSPLDQLSPYEPSTTYLHWSNINPYLCCSRFINSPQILLLTNTINAISCVKLIS